MANQITMIPYVSVTPDYICSYKMPSIPFRGERNTKGLLIRKHDGFLSDRAVKRLRKAISWLFYLSDNNFFKNHKKNKSEKFKLTFVTLTLPSAQLHSDVEIKEKLLNQFLIEAKKKWNIINYVWRAEKQENGNIHFHLIFDRFVFHVDLRKTWNRICEKLGYVSSYKTRMLAKYKGGISRSAYKNAQEYELDLKRYRKGCADNWSNPNSTDIHALKDLTGLKKYISKYMSKNEGEQYGDVRSMIQGRIWFISSELSKINTARAMAYSEIDVELNLLIERDKNKVSINDRCVMFYYNINELRDLKCKNLLGVFDDYVGRCKDYLSGIRECIEDKVKIIHNNISVIPVKSVITRNQLEILY